MTTMNASMCFEAEPDVSTTKTALIDVMSDSNNNNNSSTEFMDTTAAPPSSPRRFRSNSSIDNDMTVPHITKNGTSIMNTTSSIDTSSMMKMTANENDEEHDEQERQHHRQSATHMPHPFGHLVDASRYAPTVNGVAIGPPPPASMYPQLHPRRRSEPYGPGFHPGPAAVLPHHHPGQQPPPPPHIMHPQQQPHHQYTQANANASTQVIHRRVSSVDGSHAHHTMHHPPQQQPMPPHHPSQRYFPWHMRGVGTKRAIHKSTPSPYNTVSGPIVSNTNESQMYHPERATRSNSHLIHNDRRTRVYQKVHQNNSISDNSSNKENHQENSTQTNEPSLTEKNQTSSRRVSLGPIDIPTPLANKNVNTSFNTHRLISAEGASSFKFVNVGGNSIAVDNDDKENHQTNVVQGRTPESSLQRNSDKLNTTTPDNIGSMISTTTTKEDNNLNSMQDNEGRYKKARAIIDDYDRNGNHLPPIRSNPMYFPIIIQNMLRDCKNKDLAHWNEDGTAFYIAKTDEIAKRYFDHGRYDSMRRQLTAYQFKKSTKGIFKGYYRHPSFRRDSTVEELMKLRPTRRASGSTKARQHNMKVVQLGTTIVPTTDSSSNTNSVNTPMLRTVSVTNSSTTSTVAAVNTVKASVVSTNKAAAIAPASVLDGINLLLMAATKKTTTTPPIVKTAAVLISTTNSRSSSPSRFVMA